MNDVLARRLRYFLSPQMDIYQAIAKQLDSGEVVLDVGCNIGFGTLQFCDGYNFVFGMDIDPDVIEFTTSCIPGVTWFVGDATQPIRYMCNTPGDAARMGTAHVPGSTRGRGRGWPARILRADG